MNGLQGYTSVFVIVGVIIGLIYPFIFALKIRNEYGVLPFSWIGFLLQLASVIGCIFESQSETSDNMSLMIIITVVSFVIAVILAIRKVSEVGATTGEKFGAAFSQLFFFAVILCIILGLLSRNNNNKRPPRS